MRRPHYRRLLRFTVTVGLVAFAVTAAALPANADTVVTARAENDTFRHPTSAATLGGLFDELNLRLPPQYLETQGLTLDSAVPEELWLPRLVIVRLSRRQPVPAPLRYEILPTQREPCVEVKAPGCEGIRELHATYFFLAGELVGERHSSSVLQRASPRVITVYQRVADDYIPSYQEILRHRHLSSREFRPPLRYQQKRTMEATAYEPGPTSNGQWSTGYTATGLKAGMGVVAVDPEMIPLRTRLYVEGYGYAIAGDVGSGVKGNRIDLGFATVEECVRFGRRDVVVYVLD